MPENHETWHGVMTWHQHASVILLSNLGEAILQAFYKPESVATLVVPVGKHAPLVGKTIIDASSRLELWFLQAT